jgi:FkbM family methyltransferase
MTTGNTRVWPMPARFLARGALRLWARTGWKTASRYLAVERIASRLASQPMETRLPDGSLMRCDFSDSVQRQIYFGGLFEPAESYLFLKLLAPGMTVLDVGANCGQYTLLASRAVGTQGIVHAFEPLPDTFKTMTENLRLNGYRNVILNQAALWNETTQLTLGRGPEKLSHSGSWSAGYGSVDPHPTVVPAVRLDDYVREHAIERIDLIKMDIEGAEPFVLEGARESIERFKPTFLMELNSRTLTQLGWTTARLGKLLLSFGYSAFEVGPSLRRSHPISNFDDVKFANVIFHQNDLPPGIAAGWDRRQVKRWACSGW